MHQHRAMVRNCAPENLEVPGSHYVRPRTTMVTLPPARRNAAVYREDHARGIGGAIGGEERHQVADFARMRGPTLRKSFLEFPIAVFVAELVSGAGFQQRDVAIRADRTRIDSHHAD